MSYQETLWEQAEQALSAGKPADAICYLAEAVSSVPTDHYARMMLGIALGDAGHPEAALRIIYRLAEHLVHHGKLLPAIAVIRQGLSRAVDHPGLLQLLAQLHVRASRAKAGNVTDSPALQAPGISAPGQVSASTLREMPVPERLAHAAQIGEALPATGAAIAPTPLPLFCELETPTFVNTVKQLQYHRVPAGSYLLEEGAQADSLLILISGHASVSKGSTVVGQLAAGAVVGEMALITRAPRSATVTAMDMVEYFELSRADVAALSENQPKVLQELVAYCRNRLLLNLLRTSLLFNQLDESARQQLLGRFQTITLSPGEAVIQQGQMSPGLFVIASGEVQVQIGTGIDAVIVATLGPGQVFGEISLVRNQPASADVIPISTVGAIVLPAADFQRVLVEYPAVRQYLETLGDDRLAASSAIAQMNFADPDDLVVL